MTVEVEQAITVPSTVELGGDIGGLSLDELRAVKDCCDEGIVEALAWRQTITDEIGRQKAALGKPVEVHSEELRILQNLNEMALSLGLDPALVTNLWRELFGDARRRQSEQRRRLGLTAIGQQPTEQE